ncbi:MAG: LysR family transcriptional regulator [Candidatus Competibacterales bacterium]
MAHSSRPPQRPGRLRQLRGFCWVAKLSSVSRAAEQLGLSQPTVSQQLQALEAELGVVLFERRGPRIHLTNDGQRLFEMALPLVEGLDHLGETFKSGERRLDRGQIDIAAGESTLLHLLPEVVERFTEDYPGVRLRLHNGPGRQGLARLRADEVDFAVGSFRDAPDDVSYRPLKSYDQFLIAPRDHPLGDLKPGDVTLAAISHYPFILPPRHLITWSMVELAFQREGLALQVQLEVGGWELIKAYVARDLGVSIVSGICLDGTEPLIAIGLQRYFPRRHYGVVTRRGKFLSPQARRFIEYIDPHFFKAGSAHP